jgi:2-dehydropantoate 2-reductase
MKEKILIVGAGAVGGIVSTLLTGSGYDVTLVTKYPQVAKAANSVGLRVSGFCGAHHDRVRTVDDLSQLQGPYDYVLIATKVPDLEEAATSILPFLHDKSRVVSLQNGIVEEKLASVVGLERTVGCVVGWGATMHSRGVLEMTSGGEFIVGYLEKPADDQLRFIHSMFNTIVPAEISNQILAHLYSKLIINSCITTVGAICGLNLGTMLRKKRLRLVFIAIIREAIAVANGLRLRVKPYAGRLDYYQFLAWSSLRKHLFLLAFGSKYRKLKSSSLQSLERGKKTEIDFLNGYIVEKSAEAGKMVPINRKLTDMVKEIEDGKRPVTYENFRERSFTELLKSY